MFPPLPPAVLLAMKLGHDAHVERLRHTQNQGSMTTRRSRRVETAAETFSENVRVGTQEYTIAIRGEIQATEFKLGERMNHYDAMLQALTEHQAQQQQEVREGFKGISLQLELLREQVAARTHDLSNHITATEQKINEVMELLDQRAEDGN